MKYEKLTKLSIRSNSELNEHWVQERIAEDPIILGLGDVIVKDKERIHAGAGRLDLLLQEADGSRRYEVEIQLGKSYEARGGTVRIIEASRGMEKYHEVQQRLSGGRRLCERGRVPGTETFWGRTA